MFDEFLCLESEIVEGKEVKKVSLPKVLSRLVYATAGYAIGAKTDIALEVMPRS